MIAPALHEGRYYLKDCASRIPRWWRMYSCSSCFVPLCLMFSLTLWYSHVMWGQCDARLTRLWLMIYWQIVTITAERITFICVKVEDLIARSYFQRILSKPTSPIPNMISIFVNMLVHITQISPITVFYTHKIESKIIDPPSLPDRYICIIKDAYFLYSCTPWGSSW